MVVVLLAIFYAVDGIANWGKIHGNVTIGGLDVGGMTVAEAEEAISEEYGSLGTDTTVVLYASEETMETYAESSEEDIVSDATAISFDYDTMDTFAETAADATVFTLTASDLSTQVDSEGLAEEAYSVGRGSNFLLGRLSAVLFGKSIDVRVTTDSIYTEALEGMLTSVLGYEMVNPDISYEEGTFVTVSGNDGYEVDSEQFAQLYSDAVVSGGNSLVVPMSDVPMQIDDEAAAAAAELAQTSTASSVTVQIDDLSWEVTSDDLGNLTSTYVSGTELVPYIGYELLEEYTDGLEGLSDKCTDAVDVFFTYDGSSLGYTAESEGVGVDYVELCERMNSIVYGSETLAYDAGEIEEEDASADADSDSTDGSDDGSSGDADADAEEEEEVDYTESDAARIVTIELEVTQPSLSYADAVELGLTSELIYEFSTSYSSASSGKAYNIELLSSMLTNTIIAPGETFSLNDTAGECTVEKGFQEANTIVNGEMSSSIGGGICQVATTIYDAVFYAGYQIDERHNHSTYVSSYGDGMDAAIAYPYLDLKFTNDTDNYMILLLDCDGSTVTCSLWGISPERTVESEQLSWETGEEYETIERDDDEEYVGTEYHKSYGSNGHIIKIGRTVYDAEGNVVHEDTFTSTYAAVDEIIMVGTKEYETTEDDEEDSSGDSSETDSSDGSDDSSSDSSESTDGTDES